MQTTAPSNFRQTALLSAIAAALAIGLSACGGDGSSGSSVPPQSSTAVRTTTVLNTQGWRFTLDQTQNLTNVTAAQALASGGTPVQLPHTWNATDASNDNSLAPYYRGVGWYRLDFANPGSTGSQFLQFDGASVVTDVWLNGTKLGTHSGAFGAFRFDVTSLLTSGTNTLVVKCNNTLAVTAADPTYVAPLAGDFNVSGGLYRNVSLVSTPRTVEIALDDYGSSGVAATTTGITGITNSGITATGNAAIQVVTKLNNNSATDGTFKVRASLIDPDGTVVVSNTSDDIAIKANTASASTQNIALQSAHLWNGVQDPFLYTLTVDLIDSSTNVVIDKSVQQYGIRTMAFSATTGFSLNGNSYKLHGADMHQDVLGKGWAISNADIDKKMALATEIGANYLRLAHYPHSQYTMQAADKLGIILWVEDGFVSSALTAADCQVTSTVPASFTTALTNQVLEMVRENINHPSIAMWSIGNETTQTCLGVDVDAPILAQLKTLVHTEDPTRVTTLADNGTTKIATADTVGINRYHGWYDTQGAGGGAALGADLDNLHALYPNQPIGMAEYGAGSGISQHTDNVLGGPITVFDASSGADTNFQPEEYEGFVHEQNWAAILARPWMWGSGLWALHDFGSASRNEGDIKAVNTKGIVTYDLNTPKDAYYFYQATWRQDIPIVHIVGHRYTAHNYRVTDVKVYSNADSTTLTLNGTPVGTMSAAQCTANGSSNVCVFPAVTLASGVDDLVASGTKGIQSAVDEVVWNLAANNYANTFIAAGQIETGLKQASLGNVFGSDNWFAGGTGTILFGTDRTPVSGISNETDAGVWAAYRSGASFQYNIPVVNGTYNVTLGFVEPTSTTAVGGRVFSVTANGSAVASLTNFDILATAGAYRKVVTRTFPVTVTNGLLNLTFTGNGTASAVVSNITVHS